MKRIFLLLRTLVMVGTYSCLSLIASSAIAVDSLPNCPPETLFDTELGECIPVNNLIDVIRGVPRDLNVPNLIDLRNERGEPSLREGDKSLSESDGSSLSDLPIPGDAVSGIFYKSGVLQALNHARLRTWMFIQPEGVRVDPTEPLRTLFTTARNRVKKAVEVVGIYVGHRPGTGFLGVFDWSCSEADPCPDGRTGPTWQFTLDFSDFHCNTTEIINQGRHKVSAVKYINEAIKLDNEDPPLWRNAVYLKNFCDKQWDLVYKHDYRANQPDCSLTGCNWYGPTIEIFPIPISNNTQPRIHELGFENTVILHDGILSRLPPEETTFRNPIPPWELFYLVPNRSYGLGNEFVPAKLDVQIDIKPTDDRNRVRPGSKGGRIRVAILSNDEFDAQKVKLASVRFGPDKARVERSRVKDIDNDDRPDLLVRFRLGKTGIVCGDSEASLTGETNSGLAIQGSDFVKTVGCRKNP